MMISDEKPAGLLPHEIRGVAVESDTHPQTVEKVLAGRPTRPLQRQRVLRVLRAKGLEHLIPETAPVRRSRGR
jgi:hypothetical protein